MPNQIVKAHIQNGHARQIAQTVVAEYQSIRDAEGDIEDAQIKGLYARYEWGRALCNAVTDVEATQTAFCKEIAARLDKSVSYVQHHLRFARACVEKHSDFEPPVAGYIAECHGRGRKLTWSAAIRWMSSSTGQDTDEDSEEVHHTMKEVERRMEALEEAAEDLSEQYLDQGDSLDADEREAVEGVLTRARQALQDERHRMETLPVEDEKRVECEPYRRWVADHACCHCGVTDHTVVMHHPEHVYADDGGHATKISDFLGVPLCFDCHREAEGPEERFWEQSRIDPREVAARLQSEWNAKLTQIE
jgi:mannitol-1-phosphate/altronate dehydrogenase